MSLTVPVKGVRVRGKGARLRQPSTAGASGGSSGGGGGGGATLHAFQVANTHASNPSSVFWRGGFAFQPGDVPAGSVLKVRFAGGADVTFATAAAVNTWADGSLRSTGDAGLVMVDDSAVIAVGASRSYEVYAASGSQATSGFNPWTWIAAAANDFTVDLSNRKVWRTQQYTLTSQTGTFTPGENFAAAGSPTPSGTVTSWSGGILTVLVTDVDIARYITVGTGPANAVVGLTSGATGFIASITYIARSPSTLAFGLKAAIATTTRREIVCDTPRFVRVKVWQKASGEEHLVVEYHLDFWLDGSGVPVAVEFAAVLSQHWWIASPFGTSQVKDRQIYDAVVKYGTTTLDTRTGLHHAYYTRWASLRTANDAQHARKHWIDLGATPIPTLRPVYADASLKKMMKAGYIPPLRLNVTTYVDASGYASTHDPLGLNPAVANFPHGHRGDINGTGPYAGRGMWTDPDSRLISQQASATAATVELCWRKSRVMAQAGLSVYIHVRDHRSASGVNGGTDAPNRIIPAKIRRDATQTYSGLGALAVYAWALMDNDTGTSTLTHDAPVGGTGGFIKGSYDSAHCTNYSGAMAFLEGEAYLGDAAVSQFNGQHFFFNFNIYDHDPRRMYHNLPTRQAAQSIPADNFGTLIHMRGETRSLAWSINAMNHAYMVRADAHPELAFIKDMVRNSDDWLSSSYDYLTTGHRNKGFAYGSIEQHFVAPWMANWQGLATDHARRLYDFLPNNARGMNGFAEAQLLAGRFCINVVATAPGAVFGYRTMFGTDDGGLVLVPNTECHVNIDSCTFASNVGTAVPLTTGYGWANGDIVRFSYLDSGGNVQTQPTGVNTTDPYYMVSVSGNTFRLATSPGGTAISIGNATVFLFIAAQSFATTPLKTAAVSITFDDDFPVIAFALFEQCIGNGHVDMTNTKRDNGRTWIAPKRTAGFIDFATWNYDGDNLL